jgi:DNA-binding protein HU-beta
MPILPILIFNCLLFRLQKNLKKNYKESELCLFLNNILSLFATLLKTKNDMTKADVINEIAEKTGIEKIAVQETVESFFKVVKNAMNDGENVYFRGFGSFILKKRATKVARNISKNTQLTIPEHFIPKFKPAKVFVEKIKKSEKVKSKAATA